RPTTPAERCCRSAADGPSTSPASPPPACTPPTSRWNEASGAQRLAATGASAPDATGSRCRRAVDPAVAPTGRSEAASTSLGPVERHAPRPAAAALGSGRTRPTSLPRLLDGGQNPASAGRAQEGPELGGGDVLVRAAIDDAA